MGHSFCFYLRSLAGFRGFRALSQEGQDVSSRGRQVDGISGQAGRTRQGDRDAGDQENGRLEGTATIGGLARCLGVMQNVEEAVDKVRNTL